MSMNFDPRMDKVLGCGTTQQDIVDTVKKMRLEQPELFDQKPLSYSEAFSRNKSLELYNACGYGQVSKVVSYLDDWSADVNFIGNMGQNPLMVSCSQGHAPVVAKLLEIEDVLVNVVHKTTGDTALLAAAGFGHPACVAELLKCESVDVNVKDVMNKRTAIFEAAVRNYPAIVVHLRECERVDLNALSNDDQANSPVMVAANKGNAEIVDMLAEAGAILSSGLRDSLYGLVADFELSPLQKSATFAVMKKHGVINSSIPRGFQSKCYFQDGLGKFYIRNLKRQRWLNRRPLLLVIYRV
jgi:ankyrin repeat protein